MKPRTRIEQARDKGNSSIRNRSKKLTEAEARMHKLAALDVRDLTPEQEAELDAYFGQRASDQLAARVRRHNDYQTIGFDFDRVRASIIVHSRRGGTFTL